MKQRVMHVRRGTFYTVIGTVLLQTDNPDTDNTQLVLYVSDAGTEYARAATQFYDGRFQPVSGGSKVK